MMLVQRYDKLDETFGLGESSTLYLLAERKDGWEDTEGRELIYTIQEKLLKDPLVTNVSTIYTVANIQTPEELSASLAIPQVAEQLKPVINSFSKDTQLFVPITIDAKRFFLYSSKICPNMDGQRPGRGFCTWWTS